MLTPAQKPRGFARMIFTADYLLTPLSKRARRPGANWAATRHRHPASGGGAVVRFGQARRLLVGNLGTLLEQLLAVLFDDGALDRGLLLGIGRADVLVVLRGLAAVVGAEEVLDLLAALRDDQD